MRERWEFNVNLVRITNADHVKRVLNMAAEDGWELVTIVAVPPPGNQHQSGTIVWRRRISN